MNAEQAKLPMDDDWLGQLLQANVPGLLQESGCVLLSARATLRPGPLLWLGFNPGGDDGESILDSIKSCASGEHWFRSDRAGGKWANAPARRMQGAMKAIAGTIDVPVESVCAANLSFVRTKVADGGRPYVDQCWPVVREIIRRVNPRVFICNGIETSRWLVYLMEKHEGAISCEREPILAGHGKWKMRTWDLDWRGRRVVFGFPHFSRYKLEGKDEILSRIREAVNGRNN